MALLAGWFCFEIPVHLGEQNAEEVRQPLRRVFLVYLVYLVKGGLSGLCDWPDRLTRERR